MWREKHIQRNPFSFYYLCNHIDIHEYAIYPTL